MERLNYSFRWLPLVSLPVIYVVYRMLTSEDPLELIYGLNGEINFMQAFGAFGILIGGILLPFQVLSDLRTTVRFDEKAIYFTKGDKVREMRFSDIKGIKYPDSNFLRTYFTSVAIHLNSGKRKFIPVGFALTEDQLQRLTKLAGRMS